MFIRIVCCVLKRNSTLLDVVIVNWNAGVQLLNCVHSVLDSGSTYVERLIIVDNASTDDSIFPLRTLPALEVIDSGGNLGFGRACNLGARGGSSDFILFLNPDAALFPETLTKALGYMNALPNADVGICGVQLLDEAGHISRSCTRFPSSLGFVAHAIGVDRIFPRFGHFMAEWEHTQTRQVDHVIGAFFLVRRELFETLEGFDERFFIYLEDLDFSYRAYRLGWRSVYLADVQAFHAGGGTSNQIKARRLFYSLRSRLLYSFKHFSWIGASAVLMATLFVEPASRSVLALLRRSWPGLKETWAAYGMLWQWLPRWATQGVTR